MKDITKKEAIDILTGLFGDCDQMKCSNGRFLVPKADLSRELVVGRLQLEFCNKNIVGGQLSVSPMTLVFTSFSVEDRQV